MKPITLIFLTILLLYMILVTSSTLASAIMEIDWYVVGGGGGTANAGDYTLSGTIGQPVAGLSSSAGTDLCSGFWCRVLSGFRIFLPLVLRY
jgi:hypothetical protein